MRKHFGDPIAIGPIDLQKSASLLFPVWLIIHPFATGFVLFLMYLRKLLPLSYCLLASSLSLLAEECTPIEQNMCPAPPTAQEFVINLKDPVFSQGSLHTDKGGVITAEGMRIQAQCIEYINKIENGQAVQQIIAEGDLLLEYGGRAFVGKRLEYDFIAKTGTLIEGKTFVDIWFLGGDKIELKEDGSYHLIGAYLTTCESQENMWEIRAGSVNITDDHLFSARHISFRFAKLPLFWLPALKSNLKVFKDPPIRYKLKWDKGLGPRATMRYRVFSWEELDLFFRLDYRLKRGLGAAIESEYYSTDARTTFLTRSYAAHDKSVPNEKNYKRFRLQGLYDTQSKNDKTRVHMTYDRLSDEKMAGDFKSDDFEINTQKRTQLLINHQEDYAFLSVNLQPRINRFQSLNQELPLINIGIKPTPLGSSGIITQNRVSAGYLDYVYNKHLHAFLHNRQALRLETQNQIYRPFPLYPFTVTPYAGIVAIYYSKGPHREAVGQALFSYGGEAHTTFSKPFSHYLHRVEPYVMYQGLTQPRSGVDNHYIFNIDDGYARLNLVRFGMRNTLLNSCNLFLPTIEHDIFGYGFIANRFYKLSVPKYYTCLTLRRSSYALKGGLGWNAEEHLWDLANVRFDWTASSHLAMGVEFRHRSRFDWRKADHRNYILDFARSPAEMVHTPLSDGRNTFLTRLHVRLSPRTTCHFESHHGWGRKNEPRYNEAKVDILTLLSCSWQLRVSYEHMPNDDRFTTGLSLVK